ncbi:MAG: GNAT family protein [Planctomycetota bacterium]|nr:GNAT family protein [Planctomycetota bacterium]
MAASLFDPMPIRLEGNSAWLEPLTLDHAPDLLVAASHPTLWAWMPINQFQDESEVREWIAQALACQRTVAFAVRQKATGRVVGSTRFMDIRREHHGMEIGWTWLSPEVQRSGINTECKSLLLKHAFDDLQASRVLLKTDQLNEPSQRAIERIGAEREGVLRNHLRIESPDGSIRWRHSVYYSIIREEWPAVRAHLDRLVARQY